MSRFYVGQRVRKARGMNIGNEGVVVDLVHRGKGHTPHGYCDRPTNIAVLYTTSWRNHGGNQFPPSQVALGQQADFEPILPAGLESIDDVLRLWVPEGEIA